MKLSIYLFKEKFKKNDDIKLEKYKEVTLKSDLSFNAKLFIRKRKISEPAWFLFLKDYFDFSINDPNSTTNSLVLLIESNSRVFAVTFGYGFTAIKRSQIEKNFGLKIVLNSVDDDKLDIVDYFSINSSSVNKSKHKRIHVHGGTPTYDFEIRETSDLIKMISGKPKEKNFAKKISGADSITITVEDIAIENLQSKCNELFEKYLLKDYQKKFAFIDYILPIDIESTKKETVYLLKILEEDLKKAVLNKNHEKVSVSPPRIIEADVVKYVVRKGSIKESFDELNLTDLYLLNKKNKFENPIDELSIIEYYDEQKHSAPRKMREYILFQTQHYGKTYLHISGDWYEVETEFYKSIKDRVKKNLVSYNSLQLLALNTNEEEKDYNSRLSKKKSGFY